MEKWLSKSIAIAAATVLSVSVAKSEEPPVEFGGGVDVVSEYVWRGQLLTDDPVMQPYAEISSHGLTLNVWGSVDMTDINERGDHDYRLQEMDYTLSYGFTPADGLEMETGLIYYDFPGTAFSSTSEGFVSATLTDLPLTPWASLYYDFDEVEGFYADVGVGHEFELTDKLALSLGTSLGWGDEDYNDAYFGVGSSGLNDLNITASLDYPVNEVCSISAFGQFSELLDSDIEDSVEDSDIFIVGAGIYFSY
ncbi:MAG: TorF family putative porin [Verrucomicrobiota bacterium]